jgi:hypothetical protein
MPSAVGIVTAARTGWRLSGIADRRRRPRSWRTLSYRLHTRPRRLMKRWLEKTFTFPFSKTSPMQISNRATSGFALTLINFQSSD